jgi:predicted RNase H-like nuclease (RuvC/YqgF family)
MGKIADAIRGTGLPQQKHTQLLALDEKFSEMEAEIKSLKAENLDLQAKVNPLEREVERLKKQVEQQKAPAHALDQTEIDILKMLSEQDELPPSAMARYLSLNVTRIQYFMGNLDKQKYIHAYYVSDRETTYDLAQRGKEFLVKNGLV